MSSIPVRIQTHKLPNTVETVIIADDASGRRWGKLYENEIESAKELVALGLAISFASSFKGGIANVHYEVVSMPEIDPGRLLQFGFTA